MGRQAGTLSRYVCCKCGRAEMVTGGSAYFRCSQCKPPRTPQKQAHYEVAKAIRKGLLQHPTKFACADCGGRANQYDHRDYSKPLEVVPVCNGCNVRRGPAIGSTRRRVGRPSGAVAWSTRAAALKLAAQPA